MTDRKRVLIVDDDVDFATACRVALEGLGFEVLTANDSKSGVELAHAECPDLIVLDLMMEKLYSGFSVLQELASHEDTCDVPVILVSAVTTETGFRIDQGDTKPEWLRVVEFINKPIDPVELARKVAGILSQDK
ncbi:MAG: response regulator [Armatimonadetes bacterium]|nr:response regulator [Armatimonadota bacterium]